VKEEEEEREDEPPQSSASRSATGYAKHLLPQEQQDVASNAKICLLQCCNVCYDSSFMLLVRQEVLFIGELKSCLRPLVSHIIHVFLVVAAYVPCSLFPS